MLNGIIKSAGRWIAAYIAIGIVAGLGAILFQVLCDIGMHVFLGGIAGYRPPAPFGEQSLFTATTTPFHRAWLIWLPALGGLLSGLIVYTLAPEAEGHGTDAVIEAYHHKQGHIRARIPFVKTIASVLTLTTGGSGGREGPIAQIGAGFGSFLADCFKLSDRERRIMLAAGMGAGIGAIFRAPLAGALFASEVLYSQPEFEAEVIIPAVISAVVSYCVFCSLFGFGSLFNAPSLAFQNPAALLFYIILALVLAGVGVIYVRTFYGIHGWFQSLKLPRILKPALGGLITGLIGFFYPQTLAFGYGFLQQALYGQAGFGMLLPLAFGKILTTAFSIGSGGSGGVFGPSVVIGGALGACLGKAFHALVPGIVVHPEAFVIVGMAGFFAGVSKAPISTIIMVSEMTGSYLLLLPSMLVCTICYALTGTFSIYSKQVKNRLASPAHQGEFFIDVLEAIKVQDLLGSLKQVTAVPESMRFGEFKQVFARTNQQYFPVMNDKGELSGIFSINDFRGVLFESDISNPLTMKDLARTKVVVTNPTEDLNEVLKKVTVRNLRQIPVVEERNSKRLLGMLDRRDIILFYNQRVEAFKAKGTLPKSGFFARPMHIGPKPAG